MLSYKVTTVGLLMLALTYMLYLNPVVATSLMLISMIVLFVGEVLRRSFFSLLFALTSLTALTSLITFTHAILTSDGGVSSTVIHYLTLVFLNPLLAGTSLLIRYRGVNYVIPYIALIIGTSLTYLNISNALPTAVDIIGSPGVSDIYGRLFRYVTSEYSIVLSLAPASGILLLSYSFFSLAILYGVKKVITQEVINKGNELSYLGSEV